MLSPSRFYALLLALPLVSASEELPGEDVSFESHLAPFFESYCVACHGPEKRKGKITLHTLVGDLEGGGEIEDWAKILDVLQAGEMPPEDEPQPDEADRQTVATWIESALRDFVTRSSSEETAPTTHRLTNFEYQNTLRDLLGFELNLIDNLPEDPVEPYKFNNTARSMMMGPEQMDRYAENARRAMASAIVDPGEPEVHRTGQVWSKPGEDGIQGLEIGVYAGPGVGDRAIGLKSWPATGEFRIRVKATAILPPGYGEVPLRLVMGTSLRHDSGSGLYAPVGTVTLRHDTDPMSEFEFRGRIENIPVQPGSITGKGPQVPSMTITAQNLFDNGELNAHRKSAFDASWSLEAPRLILHSLEFEAPVADVWPPEHHTRILFESPLRTTEPDTYVREVIKRFMSRAYRRPVTAAELVRFVKVHRIFAAEFKTLEEAMRETLAMVLISPQFLYHTVAGDGRTDRHYEMASKLSYFLWSSMPDSELMDLAAQAHLDDPRVIEAQVLRLLADGRSGDFVANFTTQWLSIAKLKSVNINRELFPRFLYTVHVGERRGQEVLFRPTIRDHMHDETVGFIGELIKRNASVLNIVDSDFAYLNERLAAHYGVEGVKGIHLRPVPIAPKHHLGGLLTQGSVLVGNSTGSAPHPIYRAVWLREAILGDEVAPPPAEVPALVDTVGEIAASAVTIKDLLAQHRQEESCHDCHARLDPWGIPFEQYNAIGRYQPLVPREGAKVRGFSEKEDKDLAGYETYLKTINTVKVEADARLPHGPDVGGLDELKAYLLKERRHDVASSVLRKLLTYAVGRELGWRDRFTVGELQQQSKKTDYLLRDMIVSICQSPIFTDTPKLP